MTKTHLLVSGEAIEGNCVSLFGTLVKWRGSDGLQVVAAGSREQVGRGRSTERCVYMV